MDRVKNNILCFILLRKVKKEHKTQLMYLHVVVNHFAI